MYKLKTKTMKKEKVLLKVSDSVEWLEDAGFKLSITGWWKGKGYMIDQHMTEKFPELETIEGLEELAESDMYYDGDKTKEEIINILREMGFEVEEFTGTNFDDNE
jgi:hypothetical protein